MRCCGSMHSIVPPAQSYVPASPGRSEAARGRTMSDPILDTAAPASEPASEPAKPVSYSSFTRTEKPTQGAVAPKTEERLPDPDRLPSSARRDAASEATEGQRLAAAARRERAAAEKE